MIEMGLMKTTPFENYISSNQVSVVFGLVMNQQRKENETFICQQDYNKKRDKKAM